MAIELSTAGIIMHYAAETAAGTRPTTGYTPLLGLKSIPDFNPEPSTHQTTPLDETEWHRYIPGLKDVGGAMKFKANNTDEFQTAWSTLEEAFETAKADGKAMWFAVVIPGLTKAFYFSGEPAKLGLSAIEVDSVLEIEPIITPSRVHGWDTKPTTGA